MKFPNNVYDKLKWVCMFFLPALSVFVTTMGMIWGWDLAPQVSKTIVAVNALLAMMLGISTINYNKGQ